MNKTVFKSSGFMLRVVVLQFLLLFGLASFIRPASAYYKSLYVRVAADEEFRNDHWDWKGVAYALVMDAGEHFAATFDVHWISYTQDYLAWDSDDSKIAIEDELYRLDEVRTETGFNNWGGVEILVALTAQSAPNWGWTYPPDQLSRGIVMVRCYWNHVAFADNVIQHEVSHLYGAQDQFDEYLDCVMNTYPVVYYLEIVPKCLLTEKWCPYCQTQIWSHIHNWGFDGRPGGGGPGPWNRPRSSELQAHE